MSEFRVLRSTDDWERVYGQRERRSVISIGNFDGLHLGHQKILRAVVERAPRRAPWAPPSRSIRIRSRSCGPRRRL